MEQPRPTRNPVTLFLLLEKEQFLFVKWALGQGDLQALLHAEVNERGDNDCKSEA